MKMIIKIVLIFCLAFSLTLVQFAPGYGKDTAGQVLAKLNKLSPEQRRKALIEGAKTEREVTWYSSVQAVQMGPIAKAFNKRYPFLTVNRYRVSGQKQIVKIQAEFRAGRHSVDVINGNSEVSYTIKKIGVLDPYRSPQRKYYSAEYKDKEGYFTPTYVIPVILGYNTGLVKRGEAPKSYKELLDAKWKGKMLLDTEEFPMYSVLLKQWGREKGRKFLKQLSKQDLRLQRGRTSQLQMLMAGERSLAIALHGHSVLDYKAKGAPVDWVALDPFFAKANMTSLARHAPHPHAAALFIDWLLSDQGQSMITSFGRVTAHSGVKQRFPELVKKKYILLTPESLGPVLAEVSKDYRKIFMDNQ